LDILFITELLAKYAKWHGSETLDYLKMGSMSKPLIAFISTLLFQFHFTLGAFAQDQNEVRRISLNILHSLVIPSHIFGVEIGRDDNGVILEKCSKPACKAFEKKSLERERFEKVEQAILTLDWDSLRINGGQVFTLKDGKQWAGTDGSTWNFEVIFKTGTRNISFWSPHSHTEERGLEKFMKVADLLFELSEIDEHWILLITGKPKSIK